MCCRDWVAFNISELVGWGGRMGENGNGGGERQGGEERLSYCMLRRRAPGSWKGSCPAGAGLKGFGIFPWGFPTVVNLYSSAVCAITHPSDFYMVSLGWEDSVGPWREPVQMVSKRQFVYFGRDCSCAWRRLDHCGGPPQSCPDPGRWPRLGGRERSAVGGCFANTGYPPRLFS